MCFFNMLEPFRFGKKFLFAFTAFQHLALVLHLCMFYQLFPFLKTGLTFSTFVFPAKQT